MVFLRAALGIYSDKVKSNMEANPNYKIHVERTSTYKKEDGLNFTNVDFPTPVEQVPRIKRQNDLAINVFGTRQRKVSSRFTCRKITPKSSPSIYSCLARKTRATTVGSKIFRDCFTTQRDTTVKNISVIVVYLIFTRQTNSRDTNKIVKA